MDLVNTAQKWYVYELVEPANSSVFFVGKRRCNQTAKHTHTLDVSLRIINIVQSGARLVVRVVGIFDNAVGAIELESRLIETYRGLLNGRAKQFSSLPARFRYIKAINLAPAQIDAVVHGLLDALTLIEGLIDQWVIELTVKPIIKKSDDAVNSKFAWLNHLSECQPLRYQCALDQAFKNVAS